MLWAILENLLMFFVILFGLTCPYFLWKNIKNTVEAIRQIRRCTMQATAKIQSWRITEDSDNPTACTPTLCYTCNGHVYETEFWNGTITKYQAKRDYTDNDTMIIFVDPNNPTNICLGNRKRAVFRELESCVVGILFFTAFFLISLMGLYAILL